MGLRTFLRELREAATTDLEVTLRNLSAEGWQLVEGKIPEPYSGKVAVTPEGDATSVVLSGMLLIDDGLIMLRDVATGSLVLLKRDIGGTLKIVEGAVSSQQAQSTADFVARERELFKAMETGFRTTQVMCSPGTTAGVKSRHGFVTSVRHAQASEPFRPRAAAAKPAPRARTRRAAD